LSSAFDPKVLKMSNAKLDLVGAHLKDLRDEVEEVSALIRRMGAARPTYRIFQLD